MKTRFILFTAVTALGLTACNSADEIPRKGKYQPEIELTKLDIPGITEAQKAQAESQMQTSFASAAGGAQCIEGGKEKDWKEAAGGLTKSLGGTCETVRDNGTATTADLEVTCKGTQMGNINVKMKGGAEAERFNMDVDLDFDSPQAGKGSMSFKVGAKRVGDC
ncbi:DUF3617 domain-containing protein [Sphingorhabdus arenilitoris]|uniref:DUF3617 domain-containing protein n=1 Tax=Sphingorhabdus arenilitoris TaxID=1490041 RepID=A0ABV8RJ06_9SPHN